jgi:tetratricopeptide (TPR) repeat protein
LRSAARRHQFFAVQPGQWLNHHIMEQAAVIAGVGSESTSPKRELPAEVLASLEAVRVAQENARRRARRETLHARIWFVVLVGAVGVGIAGLKPWWARHGQLRTAEAVHPSSVARQPLAEPAVVAAGAASGMPQAATEAAPLGVLSPSNHLDATEGCDKASIRTAPWRLSPEACTRAFEAEPNNASLALVVAQAEHARGRFAEAAQWARRAIDLDPSTAEAYVIIARAEADNGRHAQARRAYRSYLKLAPKGWHHAEARAALRAASS